MNSIMKKKKFYIFAIAIVAIFTFSVVELIKDKEEILATSAEAKELSNKKIGWGIKRNDNHTQPDLGSKNKQLIDEYKGIAMGNDQKKYVYLTFDEGYEAGYTLRILQVLRDNNVKATFFITAHYVNTSEDLVKEMIKDGHIIGNHF